MSIDHVALVAVVLASIPAVNIVWNLWLYRPAPEHNSIRSASAAEPIASILIPARDEEENIAAALAAARANRQLELEILVMDDHSQDRTAEIVSAIEAQDERVHLLRTPALPRGWCGKQHACAQLAKRAKGEYLIFVDADVRLAADAVGRMIRFVEESGCDLASGIPRQITGSLVEKLVVPLIHFVLLGFLPMAGMRGFSGAAWAAGCGQLFIARREAYKMAGGHGGIRESRHDGLMLPRLFRGVSLKTDLFDATDLATCRMYHSDDEVLVGFAKNATEGMASPVAILPWTTVLIGGQVLPLVLLVLSLGVAGTLAIEIALLGTALVYIPRLLLAARFRQSLSGAVLHPLGVLIVIGIQWFALWRVGVGAPLAWKERT